MPVLIFLLLFAALVLFWMAARQRQAAGLPGGRIIYSDMNAWGPVEKPLYDADLGLTGKPDYLVDKGGSIIPVEVKSSRIPVAPYDSHIYQLAAYCLLVERVMGKRPPYGLLHYAEPSGATRTYAIDYTRQLETAVLEVISEMRLQEKRKDVERSHETAARCKRCGYRSICDQRLTS
jgi:CRISPR-associated exonuclease Cas4